MDEEGEWNQPILSQSMREVERSHPGLTSPHCMRHVTNPSNQHTHNNTTPGIAWESDVDHRFAQPDGFLGVPNPNGVNCDDILGRQGGQAVSYLPRDGKST